MVAAVQKVERMPETFWIPRPQFPILGGGTGGSAGTTVRSFQVEKRLKLDDNRWGLYGREVTIDYTAFTVTPLDNGFASDGMILANSAGSTNAAQLTSPTLGSVLEPTVDTGVTFEWDAFAGASSYTLKLGSTAGDDDIYSDIDSTTTRDVAKDDIPTDGSTIYVTLVTTVSGNDTRNTYTFLAPGGHRNLVLNKRELTAITYNQTTGPVHHANDADGLQMPSDTVMIPAGGYPPYAIVPTGEDPTNWSIAPNQVVIPFWIETDENGDTYAVTEYKNDMWTNCGNPNAIYPPDSTYAIMTSPTPDSQLGGTSTTIVWGSVTDALEYYLQVGDEPGGTVYFNASTTTSTSQGVSGLPEDGSLIYIRIWVRLDVAEPHWFYNDFKVQADD